MVRPIDYSAHFIPEEEYQFQAAMLPPIVEDILKNPKLKMARELFGTLGEQRFSLVNSTAWTWPTEFKADVPGYEQTASKRAGNRLLGIRVEKIVEAVNDKPAAVTLTLVNAGGNANGTATWGLHNPFPGARNETRSGL